MVWYPMTPPVPSSSCYYKNCCSTVAYKLLVSLNTRPLHHNADLFRYKDVALKDLDVGLTRRLPLWPWTSRMAGNRRNGKAERAEVDDIQVNLRVSMV